VDIHVNHIAKRFGSVVALRETSFTIKQGEFVSLLGPSGCGKTTLLRLLAGLEQPDQGDIQFGQQTVFSAERNIHVSPMKRNIGMVFQDFALWPHLTVFENVAFGLRARKKKQSLREKVEWALQKVRLAPYADRYPHQLSGGQQQRVSFARAFVTEPGLILLDEPLSALDAQLREELRAEFVQLVQELQLTAVYVTHDQHEALAMSDRIFILNSGQILQRGTPEELYHRPVHRFVAEFIGKVNVYDDQKLFRPEKLSDHRTSIEDEMFSAKVIRVAFLGDRYEVLVRVDHRQWIAYCRERPALGETINVYLHPQSLYTINGKDDSDVLHSKEVAHHAHFA
jgi:iron(III) transport system ATP-binding protein